MTDLFAFVLYSLGSEDAGSWERDRWDREPGDAEHRERTPLAEALLWHQTAPGPHSWPPVIAYGFAARRSPSQRYTVDPVEDEWIYRELGLGLPAMRRAA